jgi:EH_Signature domain
MTPSNDVPAAEVTGTPPAQPGEATTLLLQNLRDRLTLTARDTTRNFESLFETFSRTVGAADLNTPLKPISAEQTAAIVDRVKSAIRRNRTEDELVPQDARIALRSFSALTANEAEVLLRWIPRIGWKVLVDALFRERTSIDEERVWRPWAELLLRSPDSVPLLHYGMPHSAILESKPLKAAQGVADKYARLNSLRDLEREMCQPGLFNRSWPFTALVVACWIAQRPGDWQKRWAEILAEPLYEGFVLPRSQDSRSLFLDGRLIAASAPNDVQAQAVFAHMMLQRVRVADPDGRQKLELLQSVLLRRDAFNDPRTFKDPRSPDSAGWQWVKALGADVYSEMVERLIAADMELFFNQSTFNDERRRFWLRYKREVFSTLFCFCKATKQALETKLQGTMSAESIRRARDMHSSSGSVDAFCLFFPTLVVVEFSEVGNAAYFYTPEEFKEVLPRSGQVMFRHLKRRNDFGQQMKHMPGWEAKFRNELRQFGISPSGAR